MRDNISSTNEFKAEIRSDEKSNATASFASNIRSKLSKWWNDVNDPVYIRRAIRESEPTVSERLKATFILAVIFGLGIVVMLSSSIDSYKADNTTAWLWYSFCTAVCVLAFGGIISYREAIAESKAARLRFERRVKKSCDNFADNMVRIIRRIILLALAVVTVSVALQYVPGLENHVPSIAEASKQVIDIFNSLLEKAITFIESHIA